MRPVALGLMLIAASVSSAADESVSVIPETAETFDVAIASARRAAWSADEARLRAAYAEGLAKIDRPALGIVVPVESFPNGALKVAATAGKAQFFEADGLVWCGDVTVREYSESGAEKMSFSAAGCIVDRRTKSGWLEGAAHGTYGKTQLAGDGIYFSFPDEFVKISSKVEITSTEFKFEGVKL